MYTTSGVTCIYKCQPSKQNICQGSTLCNYISEITKTFAKQLAQSTCGYSWLVFSSLFFLKNKKPSPSLKMPLKSKLSGDKFKWWHLRGMKHAMKEGKK